MSHPLSHKTPPAPLLRHPSLSEQTNPHNHAHKMAYILTLTITLLASIFTLSRASHYSNKTISNTTLSTVYGTQHTVHPSPTLGIKGKDADEMACLVPTTFIITTVVTLRASTPILSTAHTRCANITITGLPIGPLIVCTPPSTINYTPAPNTSSLLRLNATSPSPSTPLHKPKSISTSTVEVPSVPPPPPKTVFITVTHTADPSPAPFAKTSAYFHVSQPGKQPLRPSGTPSPAPPTTPTSLDDDDSSGTATGLPHFTLDPEAATSEPVEGEAAPAPEPSPEPAPPSPLSATTTETEQDKDVAWSGVDGAISWQLKDPPLARRVSRVWAGLKGMKGISRAGAPHLAPAKRERQPCEEEGEGGS